MKTGCEATAAHAFPSDENDTPGVQPPHSRLSVVVSGRGSATQDIAPAAVIATPAVPQGIWRATVETSTPGLVLVLPEGGGAAPVAAKRAASCLLKPECGDVVLCHGQEGAPAYVLSVLERTDGSLVLDVEGVLGIRASGRIEMGSPSVRVEGGHALKLEAPEMSLAARFGRMRFLGLDLLAGSMNARLGRLSSVATAIDSVVDSLSQKIRMGVREVGTEIVRAGGIRQFVRERYLLRAGRASIQADEDVTMDAKKINLG